MGLNNLIIITEAHTKQVTKIFVFYQHPFEVDLNQQMNYGHGTGI